MPFFTELQTIVSNRVDTNNNSGGLNRNNTNSRYNTRTLQFPLDIGAADKGHYLMFNINAQKKTQFSTADSGVVPTVIQNIKDLQGVTGGSLNENWSTPKQLGLTWSCQTPSWEGEITFS